MTCATGPCMVPMSRVKTRDACHRPFHDAWLRALHCAHEPSQDMGHVPPSMPCWCHGALNGAHKPSQNTGCVPRGLTWCPRAEARHMMRATSRATTATMTLDMVLEAVLALARNYSHPVPHTRYTPDASHAHADTPSPACNECPQALERACYHGKACQWPTLRLTSGAHSYPLPDVSHRKAHGCPMQQTPSLGTRSHLDSSRSPQALE